MDKAKNKKIKAVFMDCDFTLYSHKTKCFPASAIEAVNKAHENGVICIMATGRSIPEMSVFKQANELNLNGFIYMNGLLGVDQNKNTIFENYMDRGILKNLVDKFNKNDKFMMLVEKDRCYYNFVNQDVLNAFGNMDFGIFPQGSWNGSDVFMGVTLCTPEEEAEVMKDFPGCVSQRWSGFGIDIVPKGTDKAFGIIQYIEKLGIDPSECMAIGDSFNDIGMIKAVGTGVAMGNAAQQVKDIASYVTTDIDDNGIYNAFAHFGLI